MSVDDSLARITGPRVKIVASATCESALVWLFSTSQLELDPGDLVDVSLAQHAMKLGELLLGVLPQRIGDDDVAALDLDLHERGSFTRCDPQCVVETKIAGGARKRERVRLAARVSQTRWNTRVVSHPSCRRRQPLTTVLTVPALSTSSPVDRERVAHVGGARGGAEPALPPAACASARAERRTAGRRRRRGAAPAAPPGRSRARGRDRGEPARR